MGLTSRGFYLYWATNFLEIRCSITLLKYQKSCPVFVSTLALSDHVSQVTKLTRVHIRDLYRICLDLNTSVPQANALVCSQCDYCNSMYASQILSSEDCIISKTHSAGL